LEKHFLLQTRAAVNARNVSVPRQVPSGLHNEHRIRQNHCEWIGNRQASVEPHAGATPKMMMMTQMAPAVAAQGRVIAPRHGAVPEATSLQQSNTAHIILTVLLLLGDRNAVDEGEAEDEDEDADGDTTGASGCDCTLTNNCTTNVEQHQHQSDPGIHQHAPVYTELQTINQVVTTTYIVWLDCHHR